MTAAANLAFNELSEHLLIGRALEHASNPVALLDRGARVVWSNQAYLRKVEQWRPSRRGAPMVSAGVSRVCQQLQKKMSQGYRELWSHLNAGDSWSGTVTLERIAELTEVSDSIFDCILSPLPDSQGRPAYFLLLLHDVTVHHQEKIQHAHAAKHDALTGLGNRLQLGETVGDLISNAQPFCLFYMDLDGFKGVNDTFGHAVGDDVLRVFADHLRAVSRASDTPIRLGGDEFILVLPNAGDDADLGPIAERILRPAPQAFASLNPVLENRVGVSIGAARYPDAGARLEDLLNCADGALYHAKRTGKGRFVLKVPG